MFTGIFLRHLKDYLQSPGNYWFKFPQPYAQKITLKCSVVQSILDNGTQVANDTVNLPRGDVD
ncbi:hypothetical protein MASR2M44_09230 [Bacteroidota bacterium]